MSTEGILMQTVSSVALIEECVAGYASAATRAAYRSDLTRWQRHCTERGVDPMHARASYAVMRYVSGAA